MAVLLLIGAGAQLSFAQETGRRAEDEPLVRQMRESRTLQALARRQAATVHALADAAVSRTTLQADSALGAISGFVHGVQPDASGAVGATVWAFQIDSTTADSVVSGWNTVKDDGYYWIGELPPGQYLVAVRAPGFGSQFFDHAETPSDATPVAVRPGETTMEINFDLEPLPVVKGAVSGRVTDVETEEPIAFAEISVFPADGGYWAGWAKTDADGRYVVGGLASGSYYVEARSKQYRGEYFDDARVLSEATPVAVSDPDTTFGIDFALSPGGRITGRVTDETGAPIAGAGVFAYTPFTFADSGVVDVRPEFFSAGATDADGTFVLGGLETGDYVVSATFGNEFYRVQAYYDGVSTEAEATRVHVEEGETTAGIDFVLTLPKDFGSISGSVLFADGSAPADGIVWIMSAQEMSWPDSVLSPGIQIPWVNVVTPILPDGTYRFEGVPAGSYLVAAEVSTGFERLMVWYESTLSRENATKVVIEPGLETANVDIVVPTMNGVLTGRVTNLAGDPVAGASVWLKFDLRLHGVEQLAVADGEGRYAFKGLPDGVYQLMASACDGLQCVWRWWRDAEDASLAEPVEIRDGRPVQGDIDFVLPLRTGRGSITGVVRDQDGTPLVGAWVSAFASGDNGVTVGTNAVSTDENGWYGFKGLFEGDWYVQAGYYDGERAGYAWYDGVSSYEEATPVYVGANEDVRDVDFKLEIRPIFGSISGRVDYDNLDVVIQRGYVEIRRLYPDSTMRYFAPFMHPRGTLVKDGAFEISGLTEGDYAVAVYVPNGFEVYDDARSYAGAKAVRVVGGEVTEISVSIPSRHLGPGVVTGRVLDTEGKPLDIAIVEAVSPSGDASSVLTTVTEADGTYALSGLPEGRYVFSARGEYHAPLFFDGVYDPAEATVLEVGSNEVTGIDFALSPVYYAWEDGRGVLTPGSMSIHGQVNDETGLPIAGAIVYVLDSAGNAVGYAYTAKDGSYQVEGMNPGGDYRLQVTMPGYATQYNGGAEHLDDADTIAWNGGSTEVNFNLKVGQITGTDRDETPAAFRLLGNYPNPFNPSTIIRFELDSAEQVSAVVYDALGRELVRLLDQSLPAGTHSVTFDAREVGGELPSGVYLVRILAGAQVQSGTLVLSR